MNTFNARILKAGGTFYEGPLESLIIPSTDGLFGIQANHRNMITALSTGQMTYRLPGGENQVAAISGGMVKVEQGEVLVLADTIDRPEEIDAVKAEKEAAAVKEALLQKMSIREYRLAEMSLSRTINRLKVKQKSGSR